MSRSLKGALCPRSETPGRPVLPLTVRSLVREERLSQAVGNEWFFCDLPDCEAVYFTRDGRTILKDALKVRVGAKEAAPPRPVCYCFGHTVESIREEIERTGRSTVTESITARIKAGECACETLNPKGTCCLGDVNRAVQGACAACERREENAVQGVKASEHGGHDCCAPIPGNGGPDGGPTTALRPIAAPRLHGG